MNLFGKLKIQVEDLVELAVVRMVSNSGWCRLPIA